MNGETEFFYSDSTFDSSIVYASSRAAICVVIGILFGFASTYGGACVLRRRVGNVEVASWFGAGAACLCFLVAICIYATNFSVPSGFHRGYSFALVCLAICFSAFAAFLFWPVQKQTQIQAWASA